MMTTNIQMLHQTRHDEYKRDVAELAALTGCDKDMVDRWCKELAQTSATFTHIEAVSEIRSLWLMPGLGALMDTLELWKK